MHFQATQYTNQIKLRATPNEKQRYKCYAITFIIIRKFQYLHDCSQYIKQTVNQSKLDSSAAWLSEMLPQSFHYKFVQKFAKTSIKGNFPTQAEMAHIYSFLCGSIG